MIKRFPKKFFIDNIILKKVSIQNDEKILNELLSLYKKNRKHLFYWHHRMEQLLFENIDDITDHIKKCQLICYAIYNMNKIIGCIEINKLNKDEESKTYRTISYWVDRDNARKGIMYNCLKILEKYFVSQGINILCADVNMENIPSINLLEKSGFKKYKSRFIALKKGKALCRIYSFQKIIKRKIA